MSTANDKEPPFIVSKLTLLFYCLSQTPSPAIVSPATQRGYICGTCNFGKELFCFGIALLHTRESSFGNSVVESHSWLDVTLWCRKLLTPTTDSDSGFLIRSE